MPANHRLTYRPDIDGLRAVAVSAVVAFHAFPALAHGGFVGVDVFFVISGYLITGLILKDLELGRFSIANFYSRRIRRIFPALVVTLVFCIGLGWMLLLDDEYRMLGKHVAAGAGFVANFALWNESGYFDTAAELKPLLHLWSLGIEEQFYIVWPALLFLTYRMGVNPLVAMVVLALVSFGLNVANAADDRAWAFFLPQARLWELTLGGVCAYLTFPPRRWSLPDALAALSARAAGKRTRIADIASIVGTAFVGSGIFGLDKWDVFPGWWAAVPVVGTALVILAGPEALVNKAVLSRKPMVFIGLISFPLYLWHWPLLSFARIVRGWQPGPAVRLAIVAVAVTLAWLTFELVEKRIRFRRGRATTVALMISIGVAGLSGYVVYHFDGLEFRFGDLASISKAGREWEFDSTPKLRPVQYSGSEFMQQEARGKGKVLIVGDSNAQQYWSRIDELIESDPKIVQSVIYKTGGGCLPVRGARSDVEAHCAELTTQAIEYALQTDVETVVFAASWWAYFEGAVGYYFLENGAKYPLKNAAGVDKTLESFGSMVKELRRAGKNVVVILNIPMGQEFDPRTMLHRSLSGIDFRPAPVPLVKLTARYGAVEKRLSDIAVEAGAKVIRPIEFLCAADLCPTIDAHNEPMYKDATHLRPSYVRRHATFIDPIMFLAR
jgi:peptidoglycan/LPS O-acetylase OafA/YrhL